MSMTMYQHFPEKASHCKTFSTDHAVAFEEKTLKRVKWPQAGQKKGKERNWKDEES